MVRAFYRLTLQPLLIVACASAALCVTGVSRAGYLPVYGSPPFVQGTGGYVGHSFAEDPTSPNVIAVNNDGIAVGVATRVDALGNPLDQRAIRWSATEAAELGHLGTDFRGIAYSAAIDINNDGTAVGGAVVGCCEHARPVRWSGTSTTATELDSLGVFRRSWANAINDAGDAVGFSWGGTPLAPRATLWNATGTAVTPLGSVAGFVISEATAINDVGTIIGQTRNLTPFTGYAVRWDSPSIATLLGHLGPNIPGSTTTTAFAINEAGVVAGSSSKHDSSGNTLGTFAVRWEPLGTTAIELQNPWSHPTTGQSEARATAINSDGTTVGYAERHPGYGPAALRWDSGSTTAVILDNLGTSSTGAYRSAAHAINADGTIVGFAYKYGPTGNSMGPSAVYWRPDGTIVDLNTLIEPNSGWSLRVATSISDTGWIAGYGYFDPDGTGGQNAYPRLFLIHVPEPTSLFLVGFGVLVVCLVSRRRR